MWPDKNMRPDMMPVRLPMSAQCHPVTGGHRHLTWRAATTWCRPLVLLSQIIMKKNNKPTYRIMENI